MVEGPSGCCAGVREQPCGSSVGEPGFIKDNFIVGEKSKQVRGHGSESGLHPE